MNTSGKHFGINYLTSSATPVLFSKAFGINAGAFASAGVFDPTLNIDSLFFPDPLLCEKSSHAEMREARESFEEHFENVRILLHGSNGNEGPALKAVRKRLTFPEIKGTCLGYGKDGIAGSGAGQKMAEQLIASGLEIVRLGIDHPDLFLAMGLFEKDFGPDLVGDMFTNVCLKNIEAFNRRIQAQFSLPSRKLTVKCWSGDFEGIFTENPLLPGIPVIFMPTDILRDLPLAVDWGEVQQAAQENERFRDSLNGSVAELWSKKTREGKSELRRWALSGAEAFGDLLDILHGMDGKPYDFLKDPKGEIAWRSVVDRILSKYPLKEKARPLKSESDVLHIVDHIISRFKDFVEKRDLWRELYTDERKPRLEKAAQRLFYLLAHSYCEANDLDLTPEADTGAGPVDFKVSFGMSKKVLVEIKLSTNSQVVKGYRKQIVAYQEGEDTILARYVVINVGNIGNKFRAIEGLRANLSAIDNSTLGAVLIDGLPKLSASNRT